jgi:hypothetical protein
MSRFRLQMIWALQRSDLTGLNRAGFAGGPDY